METLGWISLDNMEDMVVGRAVKGLTDFVRLTNTNTNYSDI